MMQQVATKRSDVAALPIEIETTQSPNGAGSRFSEVLTLAGEAAVRGKDGKGKTTPIRPEPENVRQPTSTEQRQVNSDEGTGLEKPATSAPAISQHKEEAKQPPVNAKDSPAQEPAVEPEQTDWLALVESIKEFNQHGDSGELQKAISDFIDSEQHNEGELSINFEQLVEQLTSGVETGTTAPATEKGEDTASITSILEKLLTHLNIPEASGETTEPTKAGDTEELVAMAATLLAMLGAKREGEPAQLTKDGKEAVIMQPTVVANDITLAPAITEDLKNAENTGIVEQSGKLVDEAAQNDEDAALLLNMLKTELEQGTKGSKKADPNEGIKNAELTINPKAGETLSEAMQPLTEESKQQVAQALAEKVVALLPPSASEQQQSAVKSAVIAGVNEIQSQMAQGREPGINLQDLIATAVGEAGINVSQQIKTGIEQQLSQLNLVVQATQQAVSHAQERSQFVSADAIIQENTQLRSEATRSQQAADGIDKPVNIVKPEGQQQLSEKIRWMVNARNSFAEIRLDPPELGSMQVRVNVAGDMASVSFIVQSPQAKEALAQAEPRLREMLAEQGIELGESFVRQDSGKGESGNAEGGSAGGHGSGHNADEETTTVVEQSLSRQALGGIDDYA